MSLGQVCRYALFSFVIAFSFTPNCSAETRSAQDMAKECRVALDLLQGHVEKSFQSTLSAGECVGYVQGAEDISVAMAANVKWFRVCIPESTSTMLLIQKYIAFVDKNPKYTL